MIESIYIIDQISGIPLFTYDLISVEGSENVDRAIFSGFLKALDDFSKETRKQNINQIVMGPTRIIFEKARISDKTLLFISIEETQEKTKRIQKVLRKIAKEFGQDYKDAIRTFIGDTTVFDSFNTKVEQIVMSEFGDLKEKITLKWNQHPFSTFVSQFSMEKIKERREKTMTQIKEHYQKRKVKIKNFKEKVQQKGREMMKSSIKIFTKEKEYVIDGVVEEIIEDDDFSK